MTPAIHVRKDGPLYRVQVLPPQSLPPSVARPETYASHPAAMQAAGWIAKATGWPITDLSGVRR